MFQLQVTQPTNTDDNDYIEFAYLHIDAIRSSTTPAGSIRNALSKRLEIVREGF